MDIPIEVKSALDSIRGSFDTLKIAVAGLQKQVDAIDGKLAERHVGGGIEMKSAGQEIFESADFKTYAEGGGRGVFRTKVADIFSKAAVTQSDFGPYSASFTSDRQPGIVPIPFRRLFLRDLLRVRPIAGSHADYIRISSFAGICSPQTEGHTKSERSLNFEVVSERVRTLAHWIPASKQVLEDMAQLRDAIDSHLLYGVRLEEERQLLFGSGAGEDYNGIMTQATPFDTDLLPLSGWNLLDCIGLAISQTEQQSDSAVDGIVLSVADFWRMALSKDSQGRYVFGNPAESIVPRLWGRPVAVSNTMTAGSFLVGAFATAATLYDRSEALIEISSSHEDYFARNMVAIRCELRSCLAVTRASAFTYGSFSTSP